MRNEDVCAFIRLASIALFIGLSMPSAKLSSAKPSAPEPPLSIASRMAFSDKWSIGFPLHDL